MALGSTQPVTERSTRNLPAGKGWQPNRHLWADCQEKMWEPRHLTTLWAFTAYYRDSFTLPFYLYTFVESFKKFLKTVSKGLQRNSVHFGCHIFLTVCNILKRLPLRAVFTLGKIKVQSRKLELSGWCLGIVSIASARPWVLVGRTLRRSSSLNLRGGYDKSSPYWYLINPPSFLE
jgi:hypothetical protein